jgi:23S rRNA (cytidine1920-2'-O)/16S rRNA (cytidine1409-2'-O)-methyltransferase
MATRTRLDSELVRRGLVKSRTEAVRAIDKGHVMVRGIPATKPAALVESSAPITMDEATSRFVSRGGEKLEGALERFDVTVEGRRWIDAGASTGGFTDCLLQRGAVAVTAVDVGYGQLDWSLRSDPRVVTLERSNIRYLAPDALPWRGEGVVADLAFISLALVLPALVRLAEPGADFVLLVKPQFELDRESVSRGGVVRDPAAWLHAMEKVTAAAHAIGLGIADAVASPLLGPAGNHEFFLHLHADAEDGNEAALLRAVSEVPS